MRTLCLHAPKDSKAMPVCHHLSVLIEESILQQLGGYLPRFSCKKMFSHHRAEKGQHLDLNSGLPTTEHVHSCSIHSQQEKWHTALFLGPFISFDSLLRNLA